MKSLYQQHILEHYQDPHNFGELAGADVSAAVDNPLCGDELQFQARVEDGILADIRFTGTGCALSIAAASMLTDELQGADVERIKNVSDEDLFELLGLRKQNVSPMRMKCVLLSRDGVQQLINEV